MSHGFLRIKIHVLLNRLCYLGRRGRGGESTSVRFAGLEVFFFFSGLSIGIITGSISKCSSGVKKEKKSTPSSQLIGLKGIRDCSIRWSRERASFSSDTSHGLHLWRISLIYLLASLWVCAWSWSPGMEAPSVGRRFLRIPSFHQ